MAMTKRIHFPLTTAQQRRLLFETWEATSDVLLACRTAHVGRRTFYYWKPRFDQGGYAALEQFASAAPKQPARTDAALEAQIAALRTEHPTWGKRRIADELAKANDWQSIVSPNTVARVLRDHGLWTTPVKKKQRFRPMTRTADLPGQTVNIDLCFVPTTRTADQAIPAVSGSSGRLIVTTPPSARTAPFPGAVFADSTQPYADQMRAYTAAANHRHAWRTKAAPSPDPHRQQRIDLRHEATLLRAARRATRLQREQEDRAWMHLVDERQAFVAHARREHLTDDRPGSLACKRQERMRAQAAQAAATQQWQALRDHRRQTLAQREQEDQVWRTEQRRLRNAITETIVTTAWHAILLITDNCTRSCYGLPLLVDGPNVTSDQVVAALRPQLPDGVGFVVSDRGVHFTAHAFRAFTRQQGFVHVPISRRRPQTNGIAERMVRTLKEWLRQQTWQTADDLDTLLCRFVVDYNDRPHQGLTIPGLSPNEYARRLLHAG